MGGVKSKEVDLENQDKSLSPPRLGIKSVVDLEGKKTEADATGIEEEN
jgi:hypothetical protein